MRKLTLSRADRRIEIKGIKKKKAVYTYTNETLDNAIRLHGKEMLDKAKEKSFNDGVEQACALTFMLSMRVLMDYYWTEDYAEKLPGFIEHLLDYFYDWKDGKLDINDLKNDLWNYGGIELRFDPDGNEENDGN